MFLFVDLIYVEAMNRAMKIHALEPFLPIRVACDIYEGRNQKVEVPIRKSCYLYIKVKRRICDIPVPFCPSMFYGKCGSS